ncbi:MAG: hypothetical protein ACTFAL_16915 [Candidatus Electronema sp. V4]|uniref:hypothetical protein n=1 Tax=Candidatus Electronema sp. V4 TaxID=3454756 RepID=UPI004055651E
MRKNSLFAIDSTATCLPWWTWFVLAGLSYLLLSWIAGIEIMTGTITDPKTMIWPYTLALLKGAAFFGKVLLPYLLIGLGIYAGIQRLCERH